MSEQKSADIFFDSNVLINYSQTLSPHFNDIKLLTNLFVDKKVNIYILSSSLNEVYYILNKYYFNEENSRRLINDYAKNFNLVDLTGPIVFDAIDCDEPDYEDGLIRVAAEALNVDTIVTYDKKAFKNSFIPSMTASEALEFLQEN